MEGMKVIKSRFEVMEDLLKEYNIPYYDDEIVDYMQMFDVILSLCNHKINLEQGVEAFAKLKEVMEDENVITGRDRMKKMYNLLDIIPNTKGLLERKEKLFFCFSIYVAISIISELDSKPHNLVGVAEFESEEYIKCKMEEYWALDPYMFSFAF